MKLTRIVQAQRRVFLEKLAEGGKVGPACKIARIPRSTLYQWKQDDAEFAKAWEAALDVAADRIEDALTRAAVEGDLEPVYQGGKLVGKKRVRDTTAGIFLLKALRPEKYRERSAIDLNVVNNLGARLDAAHKRIADKRSGGGGEK